MYFAWHYTLMNFQTNHEYFSGDGRLMMAKLLPINVCCDASIFNHWRRHSVQELNRSYKQLFFRFRKRKRFAASVTNCLRELHFIQTDMQVCIWTVIQTGMQVYIKLTSFDQPQAFSNMAYKGTVSCSMMISFLRALYCIVWWYRFLRALFCAVWWYRS